MKKLFTILFTLVFAVMAGSVVASAASSPEERIGAVVVANKGGNDITPASENVDKFKDYVDTGLEITDHFVINEVASGTATEFKVSGATPETKGYFLFLADGATKPVKIEATFGNGTAIATFPGNGEVVFVSNIGVKTNTNANTNTSSPKTSDGFAGVALVLLVSVFAMGYSVKKVTA